MTFIAEIPQKLADSPFANWTPTDFALYYIERFSGFDGVHHKDWVLDQVARCLKECPIINLRIATWSDHPPEWRFELDESEQYKAWVLQMLGHYDDIRDEYEYEYHTGSPP